MMDQKIRVSRMLGARVEGGGSRGRGHPPLMLRKPENMVIQQLLVGFCIYTSCFQVTNGPPFTVYRSPLDTHWKC